MNTLIQFASRLQVESRCAVFFTRGSRVDRDLSKVVEFDRFLKAADALGEWLDGQNAAFDAYSRSNTSLIRETGLHAKQNYVEISA